MLITAQASFEGIGYVLEGPRRLGLIPISLNMSAMTGKTLIRMGRTCRCLSRSRRAPKAGGAEIGRFSRAAGLCEGVETGPGSTIIETGLLSILCWICEFGG